MKNIEILNNRFERLCLMDNSVDDGLHYYADRLSTSIANGVYTLEFKSPKTTYKHQFLREGNYITFLNNQGVRVFMNIRNVEDNGGVDKTVYCEDAAIILVNSFAEIQEKPKAGQAIDYYLNFVLKDTGFYIGQNECDMKAFYEFTTQQTILERVREIISKFLCQFYFSVELTGKGPKFFINIVKNRMEGEPGFYVTSDNFVNHIDRKVNIDHIVTRCIVRGAEKKDATNTQPAPQEDKKPDNSSLIERVMKIATDQLGKPYVWGANGPNSFDCSGFVTYCFRQANVPGYPRTGRPTTNSMWDRGGEHTSYFDRVTASEIRRGDIVLMDTGYTYPGDANHVGIYMGDGKIIHAGDPVQIGNLSRYNKVGYLRVKGL